MNTVEQRIIVLDEEIGGKIVHIPIVLSNFGPTEIKINYKELEKFV
jgi:hypothetical protein